MKTSETFVKLTTALLAAQRKFVPVAKNKTARVKMKSGGEFTYKFADLNDVLSMAIPRLNAEGILFLQPNISLDGKTRVCTMLLHESGEWMMDDGLPIADYSDPQQGGIASTYYRRYDVCSMLGIAPDEDADATGFSEDRESAVLGVHGPKIAAQTARLSQVPAPESTITRQLKASIEQRKAQANPEITDADLPENFFDDGIPEDLNVYDQRPTPVPMPAASPKRDQGPVISEAQSKRFFAIAMKGGKSREDIAEAMRLIGVNKTTEIPKSRYEELCKWAEM